MLDSSGTVRHFSADRALRHCQAVQALSGSSDTVRQFRHCQAHLSRSGTLALSGSSDTVRQFRHCQAVQTLLGSSGTSQQIGHSGTVGHFSADWALWLLSLALSGSSDTVRQFRHISADRALWHCQAVQVLLSSSSDTQAVQTEPALPGIQVLPTRGFEPRPPDFKCLDRSKKIIKKN